METTPGPAKTTNLLPIAAIAVIIICLGTLLAMTVLNRSRSVITVPPVPTAGPSLAPTMIPRPTLGSMTMKTKDAATRYQVGRPVSIIIQASSDGSSIVAYDAILSYDNTGFTLGGSTSLAPDFKMFAFDRKTYISFSAVRSLQSTKLDAWSNFPLIEVALVPKAKGSYTFKLSPEGKETSKLVTDKNQAVYPKTTELHLEIY